MCKWGRGAKLTLVVVVVVVEVVVVAAVVVVFSAIELSLGGSSPYTSTDKTNKNKIHKRNNN